MIDKVSLSFSDSGVATVQISNPPLNIYDLEMRDGLIEAITAIRDNPAARVLVLQ
ncbi:MAG: enoyl-CoA hydratase, partial [Acidimicrobiaceae bacterium]|nr:enoyl-CoA hydratase [Acidimicrobiaceae bacterium]